MTAREMVMLQGYSFFSLLGLSAAILLGAAWRRRRPDDVVEMVVRANDPCDGVGLRRPPRSAAELRADAGRRK